MNSEKLILSFYGLAIEITSLDLQGLKNIEKDYSYFKSPLSHPSHIKAKIKVIPEDPRYSDLPFLKASMYTPRNICYHRDNLTYIDYYGKGLVVADKKKNEYTVFSKDLYLRHEIVYLTILSLVGSHLDSKGLHRVHGFGVDLNGRGVLVLLPRGGGKTTLLLDILKEDNIKLISEDSPLVNRSGELLVFPIRIGVSASEKPEDISDEYIYYLERMEFGPKYLIDIAAFKDKITKEPSLSWLILVGIRALGPGSEIIPISKFKVLREFIKNSVIGLGLYQGMEFILQKSIFELLSKLGLIFSRLRNSFKIILASKTYLFVVGSDKKQNAATLLSFLNNFPR